MSRSFRHGKHPNRARYGPGWRWFRQEPKVWRKLMKTRKRRAAVRRCVQRVMRGETDTLWPLNTKPWIYYW